MCWLNCLSLGSKLRGWLWAAFRWCLRQRTVRATCTGALCAWAARWELGKDTEDSLVVVSDTGCELAGWESLDDGCGSLRSECLEVTTVCLIGMSRSGSVTFSLKSLLVSSRGVTSGLPSWWNRHSAGHRVVPKPCHLGSLLGWTLLSGTVSETKTWDVLVCLILPLQFPERTSFGH